MIVQIGFYVLSVLVFLMIVRLLKYADNPKGLISRYLLAGLVWLVYLVFLSRTGLLEDFGLPPRIPLLLAIPAVMTECVNLEDVKVSRAPSTKRKVKISIKPSDINAPVIDVPTDDIRVQ